MRPLLIFILLVLPASIQAHPGIHLVAPHGDEATVFPYIGLLVLAVVITAVVRMRR